MHGQQGGLKALLVGVVDTVKKSPITDTLLTEADVWSLS